MYVLLGLLCLETLISELGFPFNLLSGKRSMEERESNKLTCFFNLRVQMLRLNIDGKIMTDLIPTLAFKIGMCMF